MKTPKSYNFIIPLVVYPFDVLFSIGETDQQLMDALEVILPIEAFDICKEDDCLLNFNGMYNGRTLFIPGHGQTIVRLSASPPFATVAHEIFHVVEFLMRKLNMPLCLKNDEAYAYLIGYITEQFYLKTAFPTLKRNKR
ncbi:MAG: hypothetical protein JWQ09_5807 [Segetibacter sp.]|nr:hypothetical protein [Segetibacter sp.]